MARLRLDGIGMEYDGTTALDGVDLTVTEGEFLTLVGPSGCGKTTTLRLVAGFETPTDGSVFIDGEDVSGVPPERRGVGVVFQNYALFPHMTVAENVAYGLRFADPPGGVSTEERVATLLELVELEGMDARSPESLSGGQQQRVALARALAPGPRLLLLDEPMSALDAQLRDRLRLTVREIQVELEITTVYVTHDQAEALAVSDRVGVMNGGRLEQVGTPESVYHRPESEFVATFVGDNNVFKGVVEGSVDESGEDVVGESVDEGDEQAVEECVDEGGKHTVEVDGNGGNSPETVVSADETEGFGADVRDAFVRVGDTRFRLRGVESAPGETVSFCVRPERLSTDCGVNRFRTTVETTEFLGETTRVHLDWNGRSVVYRTPLPPSGTVEVGFDPADAHLIR
ncbi:MAG: ABC transporter ATP-binding protein [Halobacteriota archaeon]